MILQPKIILSPSFEEFKIRFSSIVMAVIWWSVLLLLILHHHFSHAPLPPHVMDVQFVREQLPPAKPAPEPAKPTPVKPAPSPVKSSVRPAIHHSIIKKAQAPVEISTPAPTAPSEVKPVAVTSDKPAPVSSNAEPVYQPLPPIPEDLREEAFSTIATARFHIAADGTASAELLKPSQNPKLNRLLLNAIKNWKFKPAIQNGVAVASTLDIRVHFNVQ